MSTIADVAAYSASLNGKVSDIVGRGGQGNDHDSPEIFFKVIGTGYPVCPRANSATFRLSMRVCITLIVATRRLSLSHSSEEFLTGLGTAVLRASAPGQRFAGYGVILGRVATTPHPRQSQRRVLMYARSTERKKDKGAIRMKAQFFVASIALVVLPVFGQSRADTASVEKTVIQMERDWGEAIASNDPARFEKFVADDWVTIDREGKSFTRAEVLADIKSGAAVTQSYEIGSVKVRVFGNTAVAVGSDTEKSSYKGKDTSGRYIWTDVWVMRDGRWRAVASQITAIAK